MTARLISAVAFLAGAALALGITLAGIAASRYRAVIA